MDARFGASVWKMGYFGKSSAISVMVVSSYCLHFMQKVVTHYCFWGMPFKKATTFVSVHFQLTRLEDSVCVGARRGICAFTGEPHFQLCGQDSQGRWFTKLSH